MSDTNRGGKGEKGGIEETNEDYVKKEGQTLIKGRHGIRFIIIVEMNTGE